MKVLIVVSGLVMFVPDASQDPTLLSALLVETQGMKAQWPWGSPLHIPEIRQPIDMYSHRVWPVNNHQDFTVSFKIVKDHAKASVGLGAQKDFPQLNDLTDAQVN